MTFKSITILKIYTVSLVAQKFLGVFYILFCMQVIGEMVSGEKIVLGLILSIQKGLAANVETEGNMTVTMQ